MNGVGMSPGYQMNQTYPYPMPQYTTPTYIPQQPQQPSNPSSISGRIIRSDEVVQPQEINQLRPCPVPAYQVPSPCASVYGMNSCRCGC